MAAKLNHPHICTIHEVGEAEGQTYIAMELVEGRALSGPARARAAADGARSMRYGQQMADALARTRTSTGVVHRDFKSAQRRRHAGGPGEGARLRAGQAAGRRGRSSEATTLTQASLTEAGAVVGTLAYMAPEQLRGPAGGRAQRRLGVGRGALRDGWRASGRSQGETGFELTSAILNQRRGRCRPRVPPALAAVIERCLAKEPATAVPAGRRGAGGAGGGPTGERAGAPGRAWRGRAGARRRWSGARRWLVVVIVLSLALDVGGLRGAAARDAAAPARAVRLAVLPFANLTRRPGAGVPERRADAGDDRAARPAAPGEPAASSRARR